MPAFEKPASFVADTFYIDSSSLSRDAKEALYDFKLNLRMLKAEAMDAKIFNQFLDEAGYKKDRTGLFEAFVTDICNAKGMDVDSIDVANYKITVQDMFLLYSSDEYCLLDQDGDSKMAGDALLKYIDEIIDSVEKESESKDSFDIHYLVHKLLGNTISEEEGTNIEKQLDLDGDGQISRSEVKMALLKVAQRTDSDFDLPKSFNRTLLSPALTKPEVFVEELEKFALNHGAVNHHLLQSLACASYGKRETADRVLRFLTAYSKINSGFIANVTRLMQMQENPEFYNLLKENLTEEMGFYDKETITKIEALGVSSKAVNGITHKDLYSRMLRKIEEKMCVSYREFVPESIYQPYVDTIESLKGNKAYLSAMLYFGSEIIVPKLYSFLLQGLRNSHLEMSNEDLIFLILHIDMDKDHAKHMKEMIVDLAKSFDERVKLVKATNIICEARVKFYDSLIAHVNFEGSKKVSDFNSEVDNLNRDKSTLLRDLTCLPVVVSMCEEKVNMNTDAVVLDLGCAGGDLSRKISVMGADKVIGMDTSAKMVDLANSKKSDDSQYFIVGDACNASSVLEKNFTELNLMPGQQFDTGAFDLTVSVYLFNNLTIAEMGSTFGQVYSLLKPGGEFVFAVPHQGVHASEKGYFSLRDSVLAPDHDGSQVLFKTFGDYMDIVKKTGFKVVDIQETFATPAHTNNEDDFQTVNDRPLQWVFRLRKDHQDLERGDIASSNTLDVLPKALYWNNTTKQHFDQFATVDIPTEVNKEVVDATLKCYEDGLLVDDIILGKHVDMKNCANLKEYGNFLRKRLLHQTGAIVLTGIDMKALAGGDENNLEQLTECSRIAYYLISSHIGHVDEGARGRLFDVKSANIDAMDKKKDNVLFSVSDSECDWHTDGASKDRVYDVVGLMCISPAAIGGEFQVANACNAFVRLGQALPKFMMHELTRPIPRDVLENGKGKGVQDLVSALSRSPEVLPMRIRYNSYPIYVAKGDRMRCRYMRHWIETGHEKTNWKVPTMLRVAMDLLDDALDKECSFDRALKRGEIIMGNNSLMVHARKAFQNNDVSLPPRHLLRAWLQIQKADL